MEFISLSTRERFQQTTEGDSKAEGCRFGKYMKTGALGDFWSWQAFGLSVSMLGMCVPLTSVKSTVKAGVVVQVFSFP